METQVLRRGWNIIFLFLNLFGCRERREKRGKKLQYYNSHAILTLNIWIFLAFSCLFSSTNLHIYSAVSEFRKKKRVHEFWWGWFNLAVSMTFSCQKLKICFFVFVLLVDNTCMSTALLQIFKFSNFQTGFCHKQKCAWSFVLVPSSSFICLDSVLYDDYRKYFLFWHGSTLLLLLQKKMKMLNGRTELLLQVKWLHFSISDLNSIMISGAQSGL